MDGRSCFQTFLHFEMSLSILQSENEKCKKG